MAGRLGNCARTGLAVLLLGTSAFLSGCGREAVEIKSLFKEKQIQPAAERASDYKYHLDIAKSQDYGIQLTLYGKSLDRENPKKLSIQLKSLEEKIQEYEKFKQDFIKTNGTNIYFPVFTLDSLTNPLVIAKQNKEEVWDGLNRPKLEKDMESDFSCFKLPQIYYANANAELIGILNNSEKKPILLYLNFKGDSCYNALTPIIDKLYSEFPSDCCFKINFSEENGKFLNLNQTKSKLILLYKGFRTTIYSGGEIEPEYNGGEDFTESEVSQIIKERINRYLK